MRYLLLAVLAAMSWTARTVGGHPLADPAGSALLALGCMIIGGVLAGDLAERVRLPRITGYLVLGMLVGPSVLGLETRADARFLHLFEELALGLIALNAGGELAWGMVRGRLRPLLAISAAHVVGVLPVVAGLLWMLLLVFPFLGPLGGGERLAVAALLGVIAVAVSPSTTLAVITETRARGELAETVLAVAIVKDVAILLLFTWVFALSRSWVAGTEVGLDVLKGVGLEILLSLAAGVVLGAVLGAYLAHVGQHLELTVVALALVSAELGHLAHLEHLLVCMAAGCTVRNLHPRTATGFIDALERSSPPIYVVFFALVGAGLELEVIPTVWLPALLYVLVRLGVTWAITGASAGAAGSGRAVVRTAWMGFVPQAGLSLGLAGRIGVRLPGVGEALATLVVAAVVINQLVGPVLWAHALRASGEARTTPQPKRPRDPSPRRTTSNVDSRNRTL